MLCMYILYSILRTLYDEHCMTNTVRHTSYAIYCATNIVLRTLNDINEGRTLYDVHYTTYTV